MTLGVARTLLVAGAAAVWLVSTASATERQPQPAASSAAPATTSASAAPAVDANLANQAELEQIPGIGPQLSTRILQARATGGPFSDWADLRGRVSGLGPATARKLSAGGLRVANQAFAD